MNDKITITPVGGFGEVGKNTLLFEINKEIFIIDAGIKFSADDKDIDIILPDLEYIYSKREKIKGIFITHGHEDHIGALPKLDFLKVPIFCSSLTKEILKKKLNKNQLNQIKEIEINKKYDFNSFSISWYPVVHSIPDSCGLIIKTKNTNIVHTGDFRIDNTPVFGENTNFDKVSKSIDNKCDVLLTDSTNSTIKSKKISEKEIEKGFKKYFSHSSRIIVCTFASQISRLQIAINVAKKLNKKIIVLGSTYNRNLSISRKLNILNNEESVLINLKQSKQISNKELIYFVTGSQGEEFSVLNRLSQKKYKDLQLNNNDIVLMSSSIIPGNEKVVANVIHNLHFLGANVNFSNPNSVLHVSGHSYSEDLAETIKKLNPKYLIPMHGNNIMLNAHKKIAEKSGVKEQNIYVLNNGDQLEINKNKIKKIESINLTDEIVLRDNNYYKTEENLNIKIKNKNIISILYFIDKDDYSKKYETQISLSNPSRRNQIIKFISNSLESNKELTSIIKSTISWEEKTRILNEKLYKLVLLEFNKDYSIKLILIEK